MGLFTRRQKPGRFFFEPPKLLVDRFCHLRVGNK